MWSWLAKVDPNWVLPIAIGGLGWLWRKVSNDKTDLWKKLITSVLANFTSELLDTYSLDSGDVTAYLKRARKYIEDRVWVVLRKRGVPKNKTTEKLLHAGLEEATAWLGEEVRKLRQAKGKP